MNGLIIRINKVLLLLVSFKSQALVRFSLTLGDIEDITWYIPSSVLVSIVMS